MENEIWNDDQKPVVHEHGKIYWIRTPDHKHGAFVEVELESGMVGISTSWGFGDPNAKEWQRNREAMDWLVEWELAEWKNIGPEDAELFATKKLEEWRDG